LKQKHDHQKIIMIEQYIFLAFKLKYESKKHRKTLHFNTFWQLAFWSGFILFWIYFGMISLE